MLLELLHPDIARRPCELCQKYSYDEATGLVRIWHGQPQLRDKAERPPCRVKSIGCPKGTPENQNSLTPENLLCYGHYRRCKATGIWPSDPVVSHNAAIIADAEREAWEAKQTRTLAALAPRSDVHSDGWPTG